MLKYALGFAALCTLTACGSSQLVQCRIDAIQALPDDPGLITPYDITATVKRFHACKAPADAGPR